MCLLSYYPEGIIPNETGIQNGAEANADGHGFAIATRHGELLTGRGLNAQAIISDFMRLRRKYPEGPAMFHSRWTTGGGVTAENCHPFQVGRDRRTVLAHNGVLFTVGKKSKMCDTRIFASYHMPERYRNLDRPKDRRKLEKYLGSFNKIAVITVNRRYRHNGYLFNEGAGLWTVEGEWHSNSDYQAPPAYSHYGGSTWYPDWQSEPYSDKGAIDVSGYGEDGEPWAREKGLDCDYCGSRGSVNDATLYCANCRSCSDCGDDELECLCYIPPKLREQIGAESGGYSVSLAHINGPVEASHDWKSAEDVTEIEIEEAGSCI